MASISEIESKRRFDELIETASWEIELPTEWDDYFDQAGEVFTFTVDDRRSPRLISRQRGLLWFEDSTLPRSDHHFGIYTRDIAPTGASFLAPFRIFPGERVRIELPILEVKLTVVRTSKVTDKCYEIGGRLSQNFHCWIG